LAAETTSERNAILEDIKTNQAEETRKTLQSEVGIAKTNENLLT
jgi:hypothetical protein